MCNPMLMTQTGYVVVDASLSSRQNTQNTEAEVPATCNDFAYVVAVQRPDGELEIVDTQADAISQDRTLPTALAQLRESVEEHLSGVNDIYFLPASPTQFIRLSATVKRAVSEDDLQEFWSSPIDVARVYAAAARISSVGNECKETLRLPESSAARCETLARQVLPRLLRSYKFDATTAAMYPARMHEVQRATASEPERFVRLRGLVWASTEDDIRAWVGRVPYLTILDVTILRDGYGKSKGEAWVELADAHETNVAVKELHHQYMRNRYIEVFHCTGADLSTRMGHANARAEGNAPCVASSGRMVMLKVSRIPLETTAEQIKKFFGQIPTKEDQINILKKPESKEMDAFVEIPQEFERRALTLHHQNLNDGRLEICTFDREEMAVYIAAMSEPDAHPILATVDVSDYVVKVRGLPHSCDEYDVAEFFRGLNIRPCGISMEMERGPGGSLRSKGAYVQFLYKADVRVALMRHKHHIQARYIEVFETPSSELEERLYGPIEHDSDVDTENRELSSRDSTPLPQASSAPVDAQVKAPSQEESNTTSDSSEDEGHTTPEEPASGSLSHTNSMVCEPGSYSEPYPGYHPAYGHGGYCHPPYGHPCSEYCGCPPPPHYMGMPVNPHHYPEYEGGAEYAPSEYGYHPAAYGAPYGAAHGYHAPYYGGYPSGYYYPTGPYQWEGQHPSNAPPQQPYCAEKVKPEGRPRGRRGGRGRSRRSTAAVTETSEGAGATASATVQE